VHNFPLVSVLIPAYNHEQYVEAALQSVVDQTYSNIEIIVINDGSTDRTGEVVLSFISKHTEYNINYIDKLNEGICRTLNKGLELAKGKYVALLASDDIWLPDKIEKQILIMEANLNIGMVFTDHYFMRFYEKTSIKATDYKPSTRDCFINNIQNVNMYEKLLTENIIPGLTVFIRKDCFDKVGGFDNNLKSEDLDMWLRIAKMYPIAFIDEPLAYYRVHDTNVSNNALSFGTIKLVFSILNKQYNEIPLKHQHAKKIVLFLKFFYKIVKNRFLRVFFIEKKK